MKLAYLLLACFLIVLGSLNSALAQPAPSWGTFVDWWPDFWLGQNSWGGFGRAADTCRNDLPEIVMEYPSVSGQQYFESVNLWIGAIIDSQGYLETRVSVARDPWFELVGELYPCGVDPVTERTTQWRFDACGQLVYSPQAIADHEVEMVFADTLADEFWIPEDPIDGPHRPLGLKITRTTYSMFDYPCNKQQWFRYHVENIGNNILRDVYVGHTLISGTRLRDGGTSGDYFDDFVSYYPLAGMMYTHDDNGWLSNDTTHGTFALPHSVGFIYLQPLASYQRLSFNWWRSNGDANLDFGPAWAEYAENPNSPLYWTRLLGTPVGDLRKYLVMSNRERDWDLLKHFTSDSVYSDDGQEWYPPGPFDLDIVPGTITSMLSIGPLGNVDGTHTVLNPGESFDLWCAFVAGRDFHNPGNPQQPNDLDPRRYDVSDLIEQVNRARSGECLNWLAVPTSKPQFVPLALTLSSPYPNPFNAATEFDLSVDVAQHVTIDVFDISGRKLETIAAREFAAGIHHLRWSSSAASSGVYFFRARGDRGQTHFQKAVLLK